MLRTISPSTTAYQHILIALTLIVVSLLSSGCISRIERLEVQNEALRLQFVEIQQRMNNDQTKLEVVIRATDEKLARMEELQQQISKLTQNNALDFGQELEQLRGEVQGLRGESQTLQLQSQRNKEAVDSILEMLDISASGKALKIPDDKEGHFAFATNKFASKEFDSAEVAYQRFAEKYPKDKRFEEALLKQGESLAAMKRHNDARIVLQRLLKKNPRTKYLERAVYLIGDSSIQLKDCKSAKQFSDYLKEIGSSMAGKLKASYSQNCK